MLLLYCSGEPCSPIVLVAEPKRINAVHNFHYIKTYYINKIIHQGGRPMNAPTSCNFYLTKCTNKCTIRYIIIFTTKPTARGDIMNKPLADRIRPKTIDDIVGQKHLIAPDRPLRKIIESGDIPNLIFYGPSGVGKTTLATYIAKKTNRTLKKLNGTTASTADIKEIVAQLNTFSRNRFQAKRSRYDAESGNCRFKQGQSRFAPCNSQQCRSRGFGRQIHGC